MRKILSDPCILKVIDIWGGRQRYRICWTYKDRAIIPTGLPVNVKFEITSAMIQLLNLNGVFSGEATNDANLHLTNFTRIRISYTITGVD